MKQNWLLCIEQCSKSFEVSFTLLKFLTIIRENCQFVSKVQSFMAPVYRIMNITFDFFWMLHHIGFANRHFSFGGFLLQHQQEFAAWVVDAIAKEIVNAIDAVFRSVIAIIDAGMRNLTERITSSASRWGRLCHKKRRRFCTHLLWKFWSEQDISTPHYSNMNVPTQRKYRDVFQ